MFVSSGLVGPKTRPKGVVEVGHLVNIPELCCVCYQLRSDAEGQTIPPLVVWVQVRRGIALVKSARSLTSRGDVDLGSNPGKWFSPRCQENPRSEFAM